MVTTSNKKPTVIVYTPASAITQPARMVRGMFSDLSTGYPIAWVLAQRDINARYRQALLGLIWAFFLPLANTATWIFLNSTGLVNVSDAGTPYPIYVFTGSLLWSIFMDAVNAPMQQLLSARGMLSKLNFPKEALILSGIYQTLFNAAIKVATLIIVLLIYEPQIGSGSIAGLFGVLSLIIVGTTLGLLIAPVGMLYSDVGHILPLLMQFLMFLTPVVFPMPKYGVSATIIQINPVTPLIVSTREWFTSQTSSQLDYFLTVNCATIVCLFVVWAIYRLAMPILIERIGS